MAFQQYNSAALKERRRRQQEYEEHLAKKMGEEEDKRQKKYGFILDSPNVIENYDPKTSGEGNFGQNEKRIGSIYNKDESPNSNDGKMSPALRDVFFRPIGVAPINPRDVMKRGTRKKHTPSSARYYKEGRAKTAKIYGKKNKKKPKKVKRSKSAPRGGKRKRKQRGGNTPECQTTEYSYAQLENREGETFHVKAPETDFMNDGNYRLEDYGIDGQGGEGDGIGLVGVSGGANGDFHVDAGDITNHRVRICKLDDGFEEKRQAGGRRKKRRKTRKNKRSKKRRGKKRKTRKRRKKRR